MQPLQSLQLCNKSNICRRSASVFVGNHARLPPAVAQPKAATHHARSSQGGWSSQGRLGRQVLRTSCAPSAAHSTLAASSRPIRAMLFRKPAECFGFACGNCSSTVTSAALSFTPNGRSSNMRGPTLCSRCSLSPTIPQISPRSLRAPQTLCHNSNFTHINKILTSRRSRSQQCRCVTGGILGYLQRREDNNSSTHRALTLGAPLPEPRGPHWAARLQIPAVYEFARQ